MRLLTAAAAAMLAAALASGPGPAVSQETSEETPASLPDFPGREETFGYCIGCHSFRVVGRQGMDRARWDATLTWMSEKQNMPAPDAEMRKLLLDYLEKAYPAKAPDRGGGWTSPFAPKS